jgi:hypothetical protein
MFVHLKKNTAHRNRGRLREGAARHGAIHTVNTYEYSVSYVPVRAVPSAAACGLCRSLCMPLTGPTDTLPAARMSHFFVQEPFFCLGQD